MKKILSVLIILSVIISAVSLTAWAKDPFGTVVEVPYAESAPDMSFALPDESWGEVTAHVDRTTDNADIVTYHVNAGKVSDDLYMDVYFLWDETNLYLCATSPDDFPKGSPIHHAGDGILIDICAGILDMCHFTNELGDDSSVWRQEYCYSLTLGENDQSVDYDGATNKVKIPPVIFYDSETGTLCCKLAIPMTALGISAKKTVEEGECFSFSMCRLEGQQKDGYVGWLEWGNYYDSTKEIQDANNNSSGIPEIQLAKTVTGNTLKLVKNNGSAPEEDAPEEQTVANPLDDGRDIASEGGGVITPPRTEPSSWALEEVNAAIAAGLVPEELQTDYNDAISREKLSKMLSILIDLLYHGDMKTDDVSFTDTGDIFVIKAARLGIIKGYEQPDGTYMFKPQNILKRCEMAVIINRIANLCGKETGGFDSEVKFTDTASHWCNGELGYPVHMGIIKGTSATQFSPENTLTVEQTIMMVYRTYMALK